jgi:Sulfite exporter TauE/SafE
VLAVGPHHLSDGPEPLGYAAVADRLNLQVVRPDQYANRPTDALHPAVWRHHVTVDALTIWLTFGSCAAGFLGSLTGMGGGGIIVPLLTLGFSVDMRYAIGASLVSVIATSSASAATYVKDGYSNIRIGMFLEVGTTVGAVGGAALASFMPLSVIGAVFGVVLALVRLSGHPPAGGASF